MAPSALVALLYAEQSIWAFAAAIGLCLLLGVPLVRRQPANKVFYAKEGCVTGGSELDRHEPYGGASIRVLRGDPQHCRRHV